MTHLLPRSPFAPGGSPAASMRPNAVSDTATSVFWVQGFSDDDGDAGCYESGAEDSDGGRNGGEPVRARPQSLLSAIAQS